MLLQPEAGHTDMSQSRFDDEELFAEATEEMQADVEEALARVTEHLPTDDVLFEVADESLPVVLESVDAALTIEPVEEALTDAQKAFLLGKRADAFDEEYVAETEARITQFQETIATLRGIETATADLADALSRFEELSSGSSAESSPSSETQSDPAPATEASGAGEDSADVSTDSDEEASGKDTEEDEEAVSGEPDQADLTDSTDE
jgi:TolA-binding protein